MRSSGTVELTFIKKEMSALIDAVDFRLRHLQDISSDTNDTNRMNAGYDEEILEQLLEIMNTAHSKAFGPHQKAAY